MRRPTNRRARLELFVRKYGLEVLSTLAYLTDRELKDLFEAKKSTLLDLPDYRPDKETLLCIRCGAKVTTEFTTHCGCGKNRAVFDEPSWVQDILQNSERLKGDDAFLAVHPELPES